jgi:hypothetical protein
MLSQLPLTWLRTLIWVLCLALPLQAAAVAAMSGCGPIASDLASRMPTSASPGDASAHEHQVHTGHQMASAAATADDAHGPHSGADQDHQQCSACAACFVGAALPSAAVALAAPAGHAVQHGVGEWASLCGTPDRLERPPRANASF